MSSVARIQLILDEELLQDIYVELTIKRPPQFILNHSGRAEGLESSGKGGVRGFYSAEDNIVAITTQGESYAIEGLYVLTKHLRFTVLHELRHAFQRENWSLEKLTAMREGPYQFRGIEIDANAWAEYAMPLYRGLVTVKRTAVGKNGFARLSERASR